MANREPLPDLPVEVEYLWSAFNKMARRRTSGMSVNPITYADIEAFERKTLNSFSAWETDMIVRLDDAILDGIKPPASDTEAQSEADVNDPQAVRSLLSGIRDRTAATRAAKSKP